MTTTASATASATAAATAPLFAGLAELLPLLGGQDLLHALVGVAANLCEARLRLLTERLQPVPRLAEDLSHLLLLLGAELEVFGHLLDAVTTPAAAFARPGAVGRGRERAGREPENEDDERRRAHEPTAFSHPVHSHLAASSSDP